MFTFDFFQRASSHRVCGSGRSAGRSSASKAERRQPSSLLPEIPDVMGEQRAVRWADVDFEIRLITIRRSAPKWLVVEKSPKSNRHRRVDLTPELAEALEKIRHGGELVFCNPDGSKLRPGQFHEILWAAQRKSGLRRIKWHELRHSFASILTTSGAPLRIVQSLLSHSTIRMTERYAHLASAT
jgi:integrase